MMALSRGVDANAEGLHGMITVAGCGGASARRSSYAAFAWTLGPVFVVALDSWNGEPFRNGNIGMSLGVSFLLAPLAQRCL